MNFGANLIQANGRAHNENGGFGTTSSIYFHRLIASASTLPTVEKIGVEIRFAGGCCSCLTCGVVKQDVGPAVPVIPRMSLSEHAVTAFPPTQYWTNRCYWCRLHN